MHILSVFDAFYVIFMFYRKQKKSAIKKDESKKGGCAFQNNKWKNSGKGNAIRGVSGVWGTSVGGQ